MCGCRRRSSPALHDLARAHYALPVAGLNVAFFSATNVYWPQYRGGVIYNYGIPRDRVGKIIKRPIYVQEVYKVDNWKEGQFEKGGPNKGIKIYAPGVAKDDKPNPGPKKFADNPKRLQAESEAEEHLQWRRAEGMGPSAKGVTPTGKEAGPEPSRSIAQFGGPKEGNRDLDDRGGGSQAKPK